MKKIFYILFLVSVVSFISCSDELETNPTDMVPGQIMLETAEGGQAIMNGIYRAMYTDGWGDYWTAENSGIMAYVQAADLMGEDHIMRESGQGWFYWDYAYGIRTDYTLSYGRQYQTWNFFYTIINNANIVIGQEKAWEESALSKAVLGQAYAMRAYAYYFLIQFFQQAYVEGTDKPGVPLYTKPSTKDTEGEARGKVEDVYKLMNGDIDKAIEYLGEAKDEKWTREHESNIDYYVANGIKARIALAQGTDYGRARDGAVEALTKSNLTVLPVADFLGWNKKLSSNALWALEVIASQSEGYQGFFSHMDADAPGMYGSQARRQIATGLYWLIPDTDERKQQWWRGAIPANEEEEGNSYTSYCQLKFRFANPQTRTGDYLIMRAEEMLLIAAEAECRLGQYEPARNYLKQLLEKRDSGYAAILAAMTDAATYNDDTLAEPVTLMDEILLQRRIELWGEFPRVFDLKRLQLGFDRDYEGSNHSAAVSLGAASKHFVYPIPQAEFDGNINMSADKDQNPI
ncbi:MAG: RagB/SusD family nutrient uptake outer membrane protein [Prevotella sp.]|jgi:hypothetical protein|nr:RagB/SusD family nutrient uptake outer membrane protein [Prevotella sp.]